MDLTITRYDVVPGGELMFEAGVELARRLFASSSGYQSLSLEQSLSCPGRYWLLVHWRSDDAVPAGLESSALQQELSELVSDCLAAPPQVERCGRLISGTVADPPPFDAARNEGRDIHRLVSRPVQPFDTQRRPESLAQGTPFGRPGVKAPRKAIDSGKSVIRK